jgi:hypothetical protein
MARAYSADMRQRVIARVESGASQLPEVVTNDRDAIFEFRKRRRIAIAHNALPDQGVTNGSAGETITAESRSISLRAVRRSHALRTMPRLSRRARGDTASCRQV